MLCDAAADVEAEGGDFFIGDPDAGVCLVARGGECEIGEGADEDFFNRRDEGADGEFAGGDIDNEVTDDLAGAVIRNASAAIDVHDINPRPRDGVKRRFPVVATILATDRKDRWMFADDERVGNFAATAGVT